MTEKNYELGITQSFPCNYLPEQQERLLVATDPLLQNSEKYSWLMTQGFRRSGDQIYRPHCLSCQACMSLRVLVNDFVASKSQKRVLKKNKLLSTRLSNKLHDDYYPLFEQYINQLHNDGSMYPANYQQFKSFLSSDLTEQLFIEIYYEEQLVAVAVTDVLLDSLSAVYTFYHPEFSSSSLGVFAILTQITISRELGKKYLYLGYQIKECKKMNYKDRYYPHQILQDNCWQTINK
ncbi:arginyltransferase [Thalassotalea profundi]|uniref:Aspartate/glutamate leucyltransferase n=1 Tax=Thalassotalea profundi TaxID=2036687 RepID=A0ABQ3IL87_9GAMM|nr:arginyltransferase [Thalassotalea profundi]GHE82569.1 putative arginyl-tRNA--protein transferase [Thalassotalea profundi]